MVKEKRFSIDVETSGRFRFSLPVSARLGDYDGCYEIVRGTAAAAPGNMMEPGRLVDLSRRWQNDDQLMIRPGAHRDSAVLPAS